MKFLLLHYVDETTEMSAEESREDQALLAAWLEDTIARGVTCRGITCSRRGTPRRYARAMVSSSSPTARSPRRRSRSPASTSSNART